MLPKQVLSQIKKELYNWNGLGISIMEISHRSTEFEELAYNAQKNLRILLNIPSHYQILFCHGGARAQFSAIPLNFLNKSTDYIDYIDTGYWGYKAAIESKKYCNPHIVNVSNKTWGKLRAIEPMYKWKVSKNSTYMHYCPNETVDGMSIDEIPNFSNKIVIADCSSVLLSCPLDVNNFGMIYASAQKNIGIPGLTIIIIRNDLITSSYNSTIPSILNYHILSKNNSMFNTPVTISWYVANLIFKWIDSRGGLSKIQKYNQKKSDLLYHMIDTNNFYYNNIDLKNRSRMNISFFLKKEILTNLFLQESVNFGLYGLKGHKAIGGIRASIYNAMTVRGVKKLIKFMDFFSKKYG